VGGENAVVRSVIGKVYSKVLGQDQRLHAAFDETMEIRVLFLVTQYVHVVAGNEHSQLLVVTELIYTNQSIFGRHHPSSW
jgi:hypothetical protein